MKTFKILFLNTNIGYGGAAKMMVWLANALTDRNYDITFMTYRDNEVLQPVSNKVKLIHKDLEPISGNGKGLFKSVNAIRKYIKSEQFDMAIAFLTPSQLRLSLACKGLKTKLLFSQRADPYNPPKSNKLVELITKWAFNQADGYVFQTKGARNYYPQSIQNRSTVIPNPIKPLTRTIKRNGNVQHRIVNVSRLDLIQKRQDILISAFNSISDEFPEYVLEFYGHGPDMDRLQKMARGNKRIHFMGATDNIVSVAQNATCAVLSSDFEGIPNALLETMSMGVPSISTDCSPGGAAMIIDNYVNGIIVPRGNVKALADAIRYMLSNPHKAEQMGTNGTQVNKRFGEDIIAKQWINFIETIANNAQ